MDTVFSPAWVESHKVDVSNVQRDAIVGIGHVMDEIASLLARLADPEALAAAGGSLPRGILFYGAPGTGKTLVARYVASQLGPDVPFYECSADELSPDLIRGTLRHLSGRHPKSVLYIDEIDTFSVFRDAPNHSVETRLLLTAFLAALDGLVETPGPIVIASSNRPPYFMDKAIVRAGRLGFKVRFTLPDDAERAELLEMFARGRATEGEFDWARIALFTRGEAPADLRQVLDDAIGLAMAEGRHAITMADVMTAVRRDGEIVPEVATDPKVAWQIAVHEAGHVAAAVVRRGLDYVKSARFTNAGGQTVSGDEPDSGLATNDDDSIDGLVMDYAGWAAEVEILGQASAGCAHDLELATNRALARFEALMEPTFPPISPDAFGRQHLPEALSNAQAAAITSRTSQAQYLATQIVERNADAIKVFATRLQEARELAGPDLRAALLEADFKDLDGGAVA